MNEKLLQYIWNHKLFRDFNFVDIQGNPLEILEFGKLNSNSGPDFELAKIKYKNYKNVFRTYHPNYLWRNGIDTYFNEIIKKIEI